MSGWKSSGSMRVVMAVIVLATATYTAVRWLEKGSAPSLAVAPSAAAEMGTPGDDPAAFDNPLYVDPRGTEQLRMEFMQSLARAGKKNRELVEAYLPRIGANGALDGIERVWPACHSEAHELGKAIYSRVHDVGVGLRICQDRCNSGCMHGVVTEALGTIGKAAPQPATHEHMAHHTDLSALTPAIQDLCQRNPVMTASYSPGDCAHGVGHALMFLSGYDVPTAIAACASNGNTSMEYYCATGAYMEYAGERDAQDAKTKGFFYPCDTNRYPAACARYKMVYVVQRDYARGMSPEAVRQQCAALRGAVRLGCYHGLGNAHMELIATNRIGIRRVCLGLSENEEFACIDGAMERMAKFHPNIAAQVCDQLEGKNKTDCLDAVSRKMYDMNKDLSIYLAR